MNPASISIGLAALAGLASFLSPCVLSLVPAYVGYLGGRAAVTTPDGALQTASNRFITFAHGLAFVGGFSLVFIGFGIAVGLLGLLVGGATFQLRGAIFTVQDFIAKIGGLVVIAFGAHTLGIITIPIFDYDTRHQMTVRPGLGYISSALMGVFFSAGWSPCVGPVLGALLTLGLNAATPGDVGLAAWLLVGYSVGLAIPFLIAALALGEVSHLIRRYSKVTRYVSIVTGLVLIIVGVLLLTGQLQRLAGFGTFVDFGI